MGGDAGGGCKGQATAMITRNDKGGKEGYKYSQDEGT